VSYRPFTDNRFYPGLLTKARQEQIADWNFGLGDLSADDLVWKLSKDVAATQYTALRFVRDKFGLAAAQALAREYGHEAGEAIFASYRRRLGLKPGEPITPEQFCEFQDYAHAVMGVDAVYSFTGYDDDKAWVSRQRCFNGGAAPYSNAPADMQEICGWSDLGFTSAYRELQPALHWKNVHNMASTEISDADRGAICSSIFWMGTPAGATEREKKSDPPCEPGANTARLTVRHDESEPLRAILPIVGALNIDRYERDAELVFVENGVRLLAKDTPPAAPVGWPTLAEAFEMLAKRSVKSFACADCGAAAGIDTATSPIPSLEWVASEDIRLPLHQCAKHPVVHPRVVTVEQQQREQRIFDDLVGKVTIGADRGE